jgi:integrase
VVTSRRLSRNARSAAPPKAKAARIFRVEFNQLRADVNITRRITPHDLRRTTATAMYRADAQRRVAAASQGNTPARNRMVAILHNAAMDLWDVATEEDPAQMWEEARAIASRILAACPTA